MTARECQMNEVKITGCLDEEGAESFRENRKKMIISTRYRKVVVTEVGAAVAQLLTNAC